MMISKHMYIHGHDYTTHVYKDPDEIQTHKQKKVNEDELKIITWTEEAFEIKQER